jgi:hypothetical protein
MILIGMIVLMSEMMITLKMKKVMRKVKVDSDDINIVSNEEEEGGGYILTSIDYCNS